MSAPRPEGDRRARRRLEQLPLEDRFGCVLLMYAAACVGTFLLGVVVLFLAVRAWL